MLRSGDGVQIQLQLFRARPQERQLWAGGYQRDLAHVLELHRDVAQSVAREIRIRVTPQEQASLAAAKAVDPEVYEVCRASSTGKS